MKELSRRGFVIAASLAGLGFAARAFPTDDGRLGGVAPAFNHGVASGDPLQDRVVIWTRVTPPRLTGSFEVKWRVARDARMKRRERRGTFRTDASRDFTVKVDVDRLDPNRTYFYQFEVLGVRSPIGRLKTLPRSHARSLRFAVASCANYPYGFFHVYRRIAERADLDFVLHLGDYIYEYGNGTFGDGASIGRLVSPDQEIVSLEDYRQRYATYKTDPDLQEAHRQHPFITVWDDHETANDSWRGGAQNHNPDRGEGEWEARKGAAIRAYLEWLPIREFPAAPHAAIYRAFRFGDLAEIDMLDTRLYGRDATVARTDVVGLNDPNRQLLGVEQEAWLFGRLHRSQSQRVRWRVLGQQVMMAQRLRADGYPSSPDNWDGYAAARERLYRHITDNRVNNVVVLTGDVHSSWGSELALNPFDASRYDPRTARGAVGIELVTPAVTSPGVEDNERAERDARDMLSRNPHIKMIELNKRGYLLVDIDRERLQTEWWHVPTIRERTDEQWPAALMAAQSGTNQLLRVEAGLTSRSEAMG
jgi:alkaline phosphatase D